MARLTNPKRRHRRTGLKPYHPSPENPLHSYLNAWAEWAAVNGQSEHTIHTRKHGVIRFIVWCDERGINHPTEITRPILERYQRSLYQYRKHNGAPLSVVSQLNLLNSLLTWFRWMVRNNHILYNPAADLELPKGPKTLPKTILSATMIDAILNQADITTLSGIRNRAVMEVFYSTGIRRLELIKLKQYDIDIERGTLMVRKGKAGKDRFVPIGERACRWVEKYQLEVRPQFACGFDDQTLFLNDFGLSMSATFVGDMVRLHVEAVGITTPGSCHVFRHAMATHMLENGADIRFIQAMLGHANLETTQIYTRVSMSKLKEIHNATHPARVTRHPHQQASPTNAVTGQAMQIRLDTLEDD